MLNAIQKTNTMDTVIAIFETQKDGTFVLHVEQFGAGYYSMPGESKLQFMLRISAEVADNFGAYMNIEF